VVEYLRVFRYVGFFCLESLMAHCQTRKPFVLEELTMLLIAITCLGKRVTK